ncbi:MAG: tRNA lysidine(34) synthetase TilS [Gammaproteobacteria bacterium]|nr:tRNA lysidine(34) synthetase TilS [Gammaproteobacteria bacterium]
MNNFQHIIDDVIANAKGKRVWVAYSGGIDSHVLLHLLATSGRSELNNLHVIHINHGLHADSNKWTQHCADVAAGLRVAFTNINVVVDNIASLGMEAAARQARYHAIQTSVSEGDVVLTAQHQHDQAETLLLQLLRGAGPKGLAGMAKMTQLGKAQLVRPFLTVSQTDIVAYARRHDLKWIDDPSNVETRWARNYIRHDLWPNIEKRWPAVAKTLSRSAQHCAEASQLLDELAQLDIDALVDVTHSLSINQLVRFNAARQRNVLRYFISLHTSSLPSTVCLEQILTKVCHAREDANPLVQWADVEARRYQDRLHIRSRVNRHDPKQVVTLADSAPIKLDDDRCVVWQQAVGQGLSKAIIEAGLTIKFRQGGERIKLSESHHSSLKHLFQQWSVPPWLRDSVPLIYREQELIAVVGYGLAEAYTVAEREQGYLPVIEITQ